MSTTLPLGDYIISIEDGRNWTLKRPVTRKNRETKEEYEGEDVLGYYGTLQAACKALFREHLANAGPTTIPRLMDLIHSAELRIVEAVTQLQEQGEITWPIRSSITPETESGSRGAGPTPTPTARPSSVPRTPRQNSSSRSQPVPCRPRHAGA